MNIDFAILTEAEKLTFALRSLYAKYGFTQYSMSKFEEYDLYVRNKDFLVSDSIITFTDTTGKLMALKPDVTLSIIKNTKDIPSSLQKLCYDENVYRVSKGTGAFREIMQSGVECIGDVTPKCVGEVLHLAAESLDICGDFVLEISHLGILSKFIDRISEDGAVKKAVLKCAGEKNLHGISEVCLGAGADADAVEALKKLLSVHGTAKKVFEVLDRGIGVDITDEVRDMKEALSVLGDGALSERVQIDFSLTGDLNYYCGIIFKGFVNGVPGSVLTGGQYDRLMKKMGRKSGAIGFAVYLDMLERLGRA